MKSHFDSFITIFIVHIVNDIKCADIELWEPFADCIEFSDNFVIVEVFGSDRSGFRAYLIAVSFVLTAVDSVEECFCEVCSCTEELHLFTDSHSRYTAGNTVIITELGFHKVIVFVLDGWSPDWSFCTELLEVFRKIYAPENCHVRFRSRSKVRESVKETVTHLCNHRSAIKTHTADWFCNPSRVAWEEFIVFRSSEEADNSELHNELVNKFLDFLFRILTACKVLFCVDIEECWDSADTHCSTVLFLDGWEVAEVSPLNSFLNVSSRLWDVNAVFKSHFLEFAEGFNLFGNFFSCSDCGAVHDIENKLRFCIFLLFDEKVNTIEGYTSVVADNSASAVSVRKTCDNSRMSCLLHVIGVSIENAVIMGFSVFKDFFNFRVHFLSVSFEFLVNKSDTAERHNSSLERFVSLDTYDFFEVFVNITCIVWSDSWNCLFVNVIYAVSFSFELHFFAKFVPEFESSFCRGFEKACVTVVRSIVVNYKLSYIDFIFHIVHRKILPP